MKIYLPIILVICLKVTKQECMIYQATETSRLEPAITEEQKTPKLYKDSMNVCQDFIGKEVCCTEAARKIMAIQFVKLEMTSECQTCVNNLKRLL